MLYCKGADNVMFTAADKVPQDMKEMVDNYSEEGLRTLVLGRKKLVEGEYRKWRE